MFAIQLHFTASTHKTITKTIQTIACWPFVTSTTWLALYEALTPLDRTTRPQSPAINIV